MVHNSICYFMYNIICQLCICVKDTLRSRLTAWWDVSSTSSDQVLFVKLKANAAWIKFKRAKVVFSMCVCVWVCACMQGRGVSRPRPRHSSSPMVNMCSSDSSHWWVWDVEDANQSGADQEFPTGASFFSPFSWSPHRHHHHILPLSPVNALSLTQ